MKCCSGYWDGHAYWCMRVPSDCEDCGRKSVHAKNCSVVEQARKYLEQLKTDVRMLEKQLQEIDEC